MIVFGLLESFLYSSAFKINHKSSLELIIDFKSNLK